MPFANTKKPSNVRTHNCMREMHPNSLEVFKRNSFRGQLRLIKAVLHGILQAGWVSPQAYNYLVAELDTIEQRIKEAPYPYPTQPRRIRKPKKEQE